GIHLTGMLNSEPGSFSEVDSVQMSGTSIRTAPMPNRTCATMLARRLARQWVFPAGSPPATVASPAPARPGGPSLLMHDPLSPDVPLHGRDGEDDHEHYPRDGGAVTDAERRVEGALVHVQDQRPGGASRAAVGHD